MARGRGGVRCVGGARESLERSRAGGAVASARKGERRNAREREGVPLTVTTVTDKVATVGERRRVHAEW